MGPPFTRKPLELAKPWSGYCASRFRAAIHARSSRSCRVLLWCWRETRIMALWRQSYLGLFLDARLICLPVATLWLCLGRPLPPSLGSSVSSLKGELKKRLSNAANAIIDQSWNTSCTAPVLTPHSHARKNRYICTKIIACVYISTLLVILSTLCFINREIDKGSFTYSYRQSISVDWWNGVFMVVWMIGIKYPDVFLTAYIVCPMERAHRPRSDHGLPMRSSYRKGACPLGIDSLSKGLPYRKGQADRALYIDCRWSTYQKGACPQRADSLYKVCPTEKVRPAAFWASVVDAFGPPIERWQAPRWHI